MQIQKIKQVLKLEQVLQHYKLKPKNNMLNCPFHEDKTASLQVNLEKHYYKCHACGAKGDQIQFVQDYEKLTKREAILKCAEMVGIGKIEVETLKPQEPTEITDKIQFLEKLFTTFKKSVYNSKPAQDYLQTRNLDFKKIVVGYNGGQFHHGTRKDETLIKKAIEYGLLIDNNLKEGYNVFGKYGIVFPLKNRDNQIVSLYFRSTLDKENAKHFYLKNRSGIYPNYPKPTTKKLILTEAIIDCASLLQIEEVVKNYSLIACYGTNGLNEEIQNAIKEWLEATPSPSGRVGVGKEIIFCFDNDEAGINAVNKYGAMFMSNYPNLKITAIKLPNKDINETLQLHEPEIVIELLEQRKSFLFLSGDAIGNILKEEENPQIIQTKNEQKSDKSEVENPQITQTKNGQKSDKSDDNHDPITFLKQEKLIQNLNILLGEIGIIGEEKNRLLMLVTATTYKMYYNLHVLYQGSSGSGKTHTIQQIASLMPIEDVIYLTRVTDSSLYNYKGDAFMYKMIVFEDIDGLKEGALMAVREMISNKKLSSSTSVKDKRGNSDGKIKEIEVSFSSLSATTKGELYEDNMSRIIVLSVDESKEQTSKIIAYKNQIYQGEISKETQEKTRIFIRQCIKLLKPYEVINPFANKTQLPDNVHKPTRMHDLVMGVINQIVILNQYQRQQKQGKLIAEKQDIIDGLTLMKESIVLKMDELEGKIRTFYEALKKLVENKAKKEVKKVEEIKFTRFDIRDNFLLSKAQINHYLYQLSSAEYLQKSGHGNKGFTYKIIHWDNFKSISEAQLQSMFNKLD